MKRFNLRVLSLVLVCITVISCKKENNNRTEIHENLYPKMVVRINVDSISNAEMDTAGVINYYKQSNTFDYDSIGIWMIDLGGTPGIINYKVIVNGYGNGIYDLVADSLFDTIPFFYLMKHGGAIKILNNNVINLFTDYKSCDILDYYADFQFLYDSSNRIKQYNYTPYSTRCASNGNLGTNANYTFSSNEDTCFIIYDGDYFGCQDRDTIIYYDDYHRSKIPYLGYTYSGYSDCSLRFSNGFDVFPYSNHNYKLIKEVRTAIWNTSPGFTIPYTLNYSYQFDNNDNVKEVLVKVSNHFGGYFKDYKIKFYY